MKNIVLICGLFLSLANFAQAQNGVNHQMPDPEKMATRAATDLKARLKLTADQTSKLVVIFTATNEQIVKLMNSEPKSKEDIRAKAQKLMAQNEAKINAVLTPVQQKEFLALKKSMSSAAARN